MRRTPRILIGIAFTLGLARAAHGGGINLSWNDCGTFGQSIETFACNTNIGVHIMVASFVSPAPIPQMAAIEGQIEIQVADATVSPWWNFTNPSGCRNGQLVPSADFVAGPFNCVDPWQGQASGGLAFTAGYNAANRSRVRVVFAVPPTAVFPVDDTSQYYGFELRIRNQNTTGTGSCDGCSTAACMVLDYMHLGTTSGAGDIIVTNVLDRQDVSWQCPGSVATEGALCQTSCPVPVRGRSWGGIKSLYR